MQCKKTKFETLLQVRPDDIDMNQHVHASKYLDYVLAARFDQMERCYKMAMSKFLKEGFGWYVAVSHVEYKRALFMGEWFIVRTWIEEFQTRGVVVNFEIEKRDTGKLSARGHFHYTLIDLQTKRATPIPSWIVEKYAI
jgi:YbgC/YbaW family acyl-CoA thioester hydrolase